MSDIDVHWTSCSERIPSPMEGVDGLFWVVNMSESDPMPDIAQAYDVAGIGKGFCHEGCGIIRGITHWAYIAVPKLPITETKNV